MANNPKQHHTAATCGGPNTFRAHNVSHDGGCNVTGQVALDELPGVTTNVLGETGIVKHTQHAIRNGLRSPRVCQDRVHTRNEVVLEVTHPK
jgi:hypothetical protein